MPKNFRDAFGVAKKPYLPKISLSIAVLNNSFLSLSIKILAFYCIVKKNFFKKSLKFSGMVPLMLFLGTLRQKSCNSNPPREMNGVWKSSQNTLLRSQNFDFMPFSLLIYTINAEGTPQIKKYCKSCPNKTHNDETFSLLR